MKLYISQLPELKLQLQHLLYLNLIKIIISPCLDTLYQKKNLTNSISEKTNSLLKMLTHEMETLGKVAETNAIIHICKIHNSVIKHTIPDE